MNPARVAVIGAGPSGLYASVELLRQSPEVNVDMFDRIPAIGGLARYGVSPDHAARRQMAAVAEYYAMASHRFQFYGNVKIGVHISHDELLTRYRAIIYACGCSSDQNLGVPGEMVAGCHAASEFVGWYNGHPDFADRQFDLSGERAIVIGNGNVALDLARIILKGTDGLRHTDIANAALAALARSRIREVVILGRRGPAQASFTTPELLELAQLEDVDIIVEPGGAANDLHQSPLHVEPHTATSFARRLKLQILRDYAARGPKSQSKRLVLRFCSSPVAILGEERVKGVRIARNILVTQADGSISAQPTTDHRNMPACLVLRAVGYRGRAIPGLPFDTAKGTLPNIAGRVIDPATMAPVPGTYVVGWQKRGPRGVIGTNKICAQETVKNVLEDLQATSSTGQEPYLPSLESLLLDRQAHPITYIDWKAIDYYEQLQGLASNRPRVKLTSYHDLLKTSAMRPQSR